MKVIIVVAEEEKNVGNKHSLHPRTILISNHKDSILKGVLILIFLVTMMVGTWCGGSEYRVSSGVDILVADKVAT